MGDLHSSSLRLTKTGNRMTLFERRDDVVDMVSYFHTDEMLDGPGLDRFPLIESVELKLVFRHPWTALEVLPSLDYSGVTDASFETEAIKLRSWSLYTSNSDSPALKRNFYATESPKRLTSGKGMKPLVFSEKRKGIEHLLVDVRGKGR